MHRVDGSVIDPVLLHLLMASRDFVSMQELARLRGMTIEKVQAEFVRLEHAGTRFESHPQLGVRLISVGLGCWADYLEHVQPGRMIRVYQRIGSTQDIARQLVESTGSVADGLVVTTNEQTAGRGRLGRRWHAKPGTALLFTRVCVHEAKDTPQTVDYLTFTTAVAAARTIEAICNQQVRIEIKWPNDLLITGRKLAGILVEAFAFEHEGTGYIAHLTGIGINVDILPEDMPAELRGHMTSLATAGMRAERLQLLAQILEQIDQAVSSPDASALLADWRDRCIMMQQRVKLACEGRIIEGYVTDLDPNEGLVVRVDRGQLVHLPAATTTSAI